MRQTSVQNSCLNNYVKTGLNKINAAFEVQNPRFCSVFITETLRSAAIALRRQGVPGAPGQGKCLARWVQGGPREAGECPPQQLGARISGSADQRLLGANRRALAQAQLCLGAGPVSAPLTTRKWDLKHGITKSECGQKLGLCQDRKSKS